MPDPHELRPGRHQKRTQRHHRHDDDPRRLVRHQDEGGARPEGAADRAEARHHRRHQQGRQQADAAPMRSSPIRSVTDRPSNPATTVSGRGATIHDQPNPVEQTERHAGLGRPRCHQCSHREPRHAEAGRGREEPTPPATGAHGRPPQQPADRWGHHDDAGLGQHGHRQAQAHGHAGVEQPGRRALASTRAASIHGTANPAPCTGRWRAMASGDTAKMTAAAPAAQRAIPERRASSHTSGMLTTWAASIASRPAAIALDARPRPPVAHIQAPRSTGASDGPADENVASPTDPRWTIDQPAATSAPSPLAGPRRRPQVDALHGDAHDGDGAYGSRRWPGGSASHERKRGATTAPRRRVCADRRVRGA